MSRHWNLNNAPLTHQPPTGQTDRMRGNHKPHRAHSKLKLKKNGGGRTNSSRPPTKPSERSCVFLMHLFTWYLKTSLHLPVWDKWWNSLEGIFKKWVKAEPSISLEDKQIAEKARRLIYTFLTIWQICWLHTVWGFLIELWARSPFRQKVVCYSVCHKQSISL